MTTINKASSTIPFYFSCLIAANNFYLKVGNFIPQAYSTQHEDFFHKNQFPYASDIIFVVLVLFFMCCQH